jgi:hypothetical protein
MIARMADFLVCPKCSEQTLLHNRILEEISNPQPALPTDVSYASFLCHGCGHLSACDELVGHIRHVQKTNRSPQRIRYVRKAIGCGQSQCEEHAIVFYCTTGKPAIDGKMRVFWDSAPLPKCSNDHPFQRDKILHHEWIDADVEDEL